MTARNPYKTNTGIHIRWFTIRRRSFYGLVSCALAATALAYYESRPTEENLADGVPSTNASFLVEFKGTVHVRRAGSSEWIDAVARMKLSRQDTVRTARHSEARVRLFDGTHYELHASSLLMIEAAREVRLERGRVIIQTPPDDARREVTTPTMRSSIDSDTEASIRFDRGSQTTTLRVHRGGAAVASPGKLTPLRSNQAMRVGTDRDRLIYELPGVPEPVFPMDGVAILPSEAVEFRWARVAGARKYSFVLGRSPTLVDPILESTITNQTLLFQPPTTGTYYWQVSAIDAAGEHSAPSPITSFAVRTQASIAPAPRLRIDESTVSIDGDVIIRGWASDRAAVTIDYGKGEESVGLREDGSFAAYFALPNGDRVVRIRARARGRELAEQTLQLQSSDR